jgi:hypothetical protein
MGLFIWVGLCAIYESFTNVDIKAKVISFLFLLFSGLSLQDFQYISFFNALGVFSRNIFNYPKLSAVYLFLILSILFFSRQKHEQGLYCLLALPVVFISTAPSILTSVFIYSFVQYLSLRSDKRHFFNIALFSITTASFIAGFYYMFGSQGIHLQEAAKVDSLLSKMDTIKTAVNIIGGTTIQFFILYFPIIVTLLLSYKMNVNFFYLKKFSPVWLIPLIYIFSLMSWAFLNFMPDAVQLFSNITVSLLNICSFIIVAVVLSNSFSYSKKIIALSSVVLMVALSSINTCKEQIRQLSHSPEYLKSVFIKLNGINPIGGYIQDKEVYSSIFTKNSNFAALGLYLSSIGSVYHTISLSVFDIPLIPTDRYYSSEKGMVEATTFYKYVHQEKERGKFKNISEYQVDFINTYNLDYIIVSKKVQLSPLIQSKVKEQIVDSLTGERFLFLK